MAPLSSGIAAAMFEARIESRGVGGMNGNHTSMALEISPGGENILQILALVFSAVSVASSILAFYWFIKMRRSFRHDLIMLLIQSDMFKALWFMLYPIVNLSAGPIQRGSRFCQVNGFFLSLGIEASDFAVLMIAIHTALYIFRPRHSSGEGGLYPYRYYAYTGWVVFPFLMASLAFINNSSSYVPEGTYCYLPVRPFWYRLALAWIPRYIIFIFILGIYASIYYYVRYKFHGFNKDGGSRESSFNDVNDTVIQPPKRVKRHTLPPTPSLATHGLIPGSRQSSMPVAPTRTRSISNLDASDLGRKKSKAGAHRFMLASFKVGDQTCPSPPSEPSIVDEDSFIGPSTPLPIPPVLSPMSHSPRRHDASLDSVSPSQSRASSWRDSFVKRLTPPRSGNMTERPSMVDMFTMLRQHPDSPATETPLSQLQLVNSRGQTFADAEMLRTRDKIRRQLRFLFIYPLVYIGMWILPFVSHVLQYDDRYALNPPFALTCVTTVSICIQASVDCWLFSTREKPWRHIPGTDGSFWASLKFWSGWKGMGKRKVVHGPGKTREEMVREARAAYKRRDEEMAQRKEQVVKNLADAPAEGTKRGERSWWEAAGVDGVVDPSMSPLAEEKSNPMEDIAFHTPDEDEEKRDAEHSEDIAVATNQQIKWDVSEPVSPVSGKGSSST